VTAITNSQSPGGSQSINFYSTTTLVGANLTPQEIDVQFNQLIDPNTINGLSVQLVGSGGDGIFGNGNDVTINLAGKLSFNNATHTLVINLSGAGLDLPPDKYRMTLLGNGSQVLRNPQGWLSTARIPSTIVPPGPSSRFPRAMASPAATSTTPSSSTAHPPR